MKHNSLILTPTLGSQSPITLHMTTMKVKSPQVPLTVANSINSPGKLQPPFSARTKEVQQKGQFIPWTHRPNPITKGRFLSLPSQSPVLPQINMPSETALHSDHLQCMNYLHRGWIWPRSQSSGWHAVKECRGSSLLHGGNTEVSFSSAALVSASVCSFPMIPFGRGVSTQCAQRFPCKVFHSSVWRVFFLRHPGT